MFVIGQLLGLGFTSFVWLIAIIVIGGMLWRSRSSEFVAGTYIVLKTFRIHDDPASKTLIEISGRASG